MVSEKSEEVKQIISTKTHKATECECLTATVLCRTLALKELYEYVSSFVSFIVKFFVFAYLFMAGWVGAMPNIITVMTRWH